MKCRGRRLAWLNRDLWLGLGLKKKEVRKGLAAQESYKVIIRLCREKVRTVKAQLELYPDTAVKDSIKFCKFIRSKMSDKENLNLLLDARGNVVTMTKK